MIKEYNEEIGRKLYDIVTSFIEDNDIACDETIFQCDWVSENSLEFIDELCIVTGYQSVDIDDEEDE